MKKLSQREKVLAVFMVAILLVASYFNFVYTRQYDGYSTALQKRNSVAKKKNDLFLENSKASQERRDSETVRDLIKSNAARYMTFESMENVEKDITDRIRSMALQAQMVRIDEPVPEKNDMSQGILKKFHVSIEASGSLESLLRLTEDIGNQYSYRIISYKIVNQGEDASAGISLEAVLKLSEQGY